MKKIFLLLMLFSGFFANGQSTLQADKIVAKKLLPLNDSGTLVPNTNWIKQQLYIQRSGSIFPQYSVPVADATGKLAATADLTYDGVSFNIGYAGYYSSNYINLHGGNGIIEAGGFGMRYTAQGGYPVDPSKSHRFFNSGYEYLKMSTTGVAGSWDHYIDFYTRNFAVRGLSADTAATTNTGTVHMLTVDAVGHFNHQVIPSGGGGSWGGITGTLSSQTDLNTALNGKQSSLSGTGYLKFSGTTPSYISVIPNTDLANSAVGLLSGTNSGDNAVNSLYSGLVTNATHTGDATGSTALTVVKINGTLMSGLGTGILKNTTGTGVPSIAIAGTDYLTPSGSAAALTLFPTFNQNTTGNAATATNLTGLTTAVATLNNQSGTNTGDNSVNSLYSGLVTNATHTGDATGSTALTVVKINGTLMSGLGTGILKNTTGTGVPSIAVAGTDYVLPGAVVTTLSGGSTGLLPSSATSGAITLAGTLIPTNGGTGVTSVTVAPAASAFAGWDPNKNLFANNHVNAYTTTVTASGTTALTASSTYLQFFTGTLNQTITLPSNSVQGMQFYIRNNSTGTITINSSAGNLVRIIGPATRAMVTSLTSSGTTAADWSTNYLGGIYADGKTLTVSNTITLSGTDGASVNVGTGGNMLTGSLTTNYLQKATGASTFGNSAIFDNGTSVGINNASPAASSQLDIASTAKGVLLPRMTLAQMNAIASPASGLMVQLTDSAYRTFIYNGTAWTGLLRYLDLPVTTLDVNALTLFTVTSNVFSVNTQTANKVWAAPNGSTGIPTFRALVTADLPGISTLETDPTVKAINGIVKSNGTTISAAVANVDYMAIFASVTATDANISAAINTFYKLPVATLTTARTFTMPAGTTIGDRMKIYNREVAFAWNLAGSAIYFSDGTSTMTSIFANANIYLMWDGSKWNIDN